MSNFELSDLGRVSWMPTLKLAAGRGFVTGGLLSIFLLAGAMSSPLGGLSHGQSQLGTALMAPFAWAILGPALAIFYWAIGWLVGKFVPGLGSLISLASALVICWGDPIIFFLNRAYPRLFNVADLRFFNLRPMIFVTQPS